VRVGETDLLYVIRPDTTYNTDPFFARAPPRYFYIGTLYDKSDAPEKAMDMYQIALKQGLQEHFTSARLERLYIYVGNTLLKQRRLSEALQVVKDAVSFKPTLSDAWYLMGQILKIVGKFELAHQALFNALTLEPGESKYRAAHLNLGREYHKMRKLDKALTIYQEALDLNSNAVDVLIYLGALHYNQNQHLKAIAFFNRARDLAPDDPEIYLGLAQAYERVDQTQEALAAYRQTLNLRPDSPEAQKRLKALMGQVD